MTAVEFAPRPACDRLGFKGPRAAQWLSAQGIALPAAPNTWIAAESPAEMLVARLGSSEFFLEEAAGGRALRALAVAPEAAPAGVYPVLREDAAFVLAGAGAFDVLAQVCNVDFAALSLEPRPLVMTMMIGVAVLVVPEAAPRFRIWCDPTYGAYLEESLAGVVAECGGVHRRSAT